MKAVLVQTAPLWRDRKGNLARLDALLKQAPRGDLYVLPEMFSTGFDVREPDEADGILEQEWMLRKAASLQAAIVGSISLKEGHTRFNRLYFYTPDGEIAYYDKRHLFGAEKKLFLRGWSRVVAPYGGLRFRLMICYDLRFPLWSRGDADCLVYVASWPAARADAWAALLKARAIENQCYVLGVNRTGEDPLAGAYAGGSVLLDPLGQTVCACGEEEGFAVGEIDPERIAAVRNALPAREDADPFTLNL